MACRPRWFGWILERSPTRVEADLQVGPCQSRRESRPLRLCFVLVHSVAWKPTLILHAALAARNRLLKNGLHVMQDAKSQYANVEIRRNSSFCILNSGC